MTDRPRDRLGRPTKDLASAAPPIPIESRSTAQVLAIGGEYFRQNLPFHAHEVFEQKWRETDGRERAHWRALAQFAAGVTHLHRGNIVGGNRLLLRAADGLAHADYTPIDPTWDVSALINWCQDPERDLTAIPSLESVG